MPFTDDEIAEYLADTDFQPPPEQLAFTIGLSLRPDRREYYREYNATRDRAKENAVKLKRARQKNKNARISAALQRRSLAPFRALLAARK